MMVCCANAQIQLSSFSIDRMKMQTRDSSKATPLSLIGSTFFYKQAIFSTAIKISFGSFSVGFDLARFTHS
jgi:hypothetical protein